MSSIDVTRKPESYADVAALRGERVLLFQQFGDYQGEWVLFSLAGNEYKIWRGYYGSCSGCDDLQARNFTDFDDKVVDEKEVREFVEGYGPFCEIPRETARRLAETGTFSTVFPANYRESYSDINVEELVAEIEVQVKIQENLEVTFADAERAMSQETRRRVLERLDVPALIDETIATEGPDQLVKIKGETYLYLKDGSSERRYLLRVPDEMQRVRQAKAWSFFMDEDEYAPIIET